MVEKNRAVKIALIFSLVLISVIYLDRQIINKRQSSLKSKAQVISTAANTYTVCAEPSPTVALGQTGCNFIGTKGIQDAIDAIPANVSSPSTYQINLNQESFQSTLYQTSTGCLIDTKGKKFTLTNGNLNGYGVEPRAAICINGGEIDIINGSVSRFTTGVIVKGIARARIIGNQFTNNYGQAIEVREGSSVTIENNIINVVDSEVSGKGVYINTNQGYQIDLINNTIDNVKNACVNCSESSGTCRIVNNICHKTDGVIINNNGGSVSYNLFFPQTTPAVTTNILNNLSADPLFTALGGYNFLKSNSPARNSGDPSINNIDGTRSDIGAYGGANACLLNATADHCSSRKEYTGIIISDKDLTVNYDITNKYRETAFGYQAKSRQQSDKIVYLSRILKNAYGGNWLTGVTIQNTENVDTVVNMYIYSEAGDYLKQYSYSLTKFSSKKFDTSQLGDLNNGVYSVRFESTVAKIIVDAGHYDKVGDTGQAVEGAGDNSLDKKFYIPYLTQGTSIANKFGFIVQNSNSQSTQVDAKIYDLNGQYKKTCSYSDIKPNMTKPVFFPYDDCYKDLADGEYSIEIISTVSKISVIATFLASTPGSGYAWPATAEKQSGYKTVLMDIPFSSVDKNAEIYIKNIDPSQSTEITFRYFSHEIGEIFFDKEGCNKISLASQAGKKILDTLDSNNCFVFSYINLPGSLMIESNRAKIVVAYSLSRQTNNNKVWYRGYSSDSEAVTNGQKVFFIPRVWNNFTDWSTEIKIQNNSAQSAIIKFYALDNDTGKYVAKDETITIPAYSGKIYSVNNQILKLPLTYKDQALNTIDYPVLPDQMPTGTILTITPVNPTVTSILTGAPTITPVTSATPGLSITPDPTITGLVNPNCSCVNDLCNSSCVFQRFLPNEIANLIYGEPIRCSLPNSYFSEAPTDQNKNSWCERQYRTKGNADTNDLTIDMKDYYYYVAAVNGGKIPKFVNPDFNGDGEIGVADREIIMRSLPEEQ